MADNTPLCKAKTRSGQNPCAHFAIDGSDFCRFHGDVTPVRRCSYDGCEGSAGPWAGWDGLCRRHRIVANAENLGSKAKLLQVIADLANVTLRTPDEVSRARQSEALKLLAIDVRAVKKTVVVAQVYGCTDGQITALTGPLLQFLMTESPVEARVRLEQQRADRITAAFLAALEATRLPEETQQALRKRFATGLSGGDDTPTTEK